MDREVPYILSLGHQRQINDVCRGLNSFDMNFFVMYIIFNDGSRFVLSNIYKLLIPYYTEGFYREDYSFKPDIIFSGDYYLCNKVESVSENFKKILEERFGVHRVYYIVRSCTECTFVFGAIKNKKVLNYDKAYRDTVHEFEDFCLGFTNHFLELIKDCNPNYKRSFIFTNDNLRRAVIKKGYSDKVIITQRESECLWWASKGKSTKDTAKILGISPATVETHHKKIREKLNCQTMIEAVVEGIHRGIIGKISPMTQQQRLLYNGDFEIVNNMDHARIKIKETNLSLLNSVKF